MRTKLRGKFTLLFLTIAVLIAVPAVAVIADTINSDIVGVSGNNSGPYKAGDATGPSVDYWIAQQGSGCEATGGTGMSFTLKATHNVTGADLSEKVLAKGPTDSVAKPLKDASNPSNRFSLAFNQCGDIDTDNKTVAFTSTKDLAPGQIRIEVDTQTDSNGDTYGTSQASWFLNATDGLGPTVIEFAPTGTSVPVNTDVTAKFSEAMNATTISNSTFTLAGPSGSVSGPVTYNGTTNTATLNPFGSTATNLAYNTEYTATVTTGAKDLAGNALDQDGAAGTQDSKTWTFTTEPPPNSAPVANDQSASTNEDNSTTITLSATDEDDDNLTFEITDEPDNGQGGPLVPASPTTAQVTYTPNPNYNGPDSFKYRVNDGTVNSNEATVSITVSPANDAPSFTAGANETVNEDSGARSVPNWATGISAGPADEAGQTVSFALNNDNNALFSDQPDIDANGTLTYTPAANAFGTANVTVFAQDNGGTANDGDDTSDTQTFTITVTGVNDAPSFTKGADQTVNEDAGAQSVPWATSISAGPNESQTVSFVVTSNSNPSLFSAAPSVAADGTLTYTPAANANGNATIKVKITDDGGTANGGVNESAEQTFTITVNPVNDAPSFTKGANQTVLENSGAHTVPGWATSISAGPANESGQAVDFIVSANNTALFSVPPAVSPTGTLTYTLAPNTIGTATVSVQIHDDGGTANGGVNTSAVQTFTIDVNYNFDGFRSPVDNLPTWNTVKAGSSIPVKFSLSGFKGMNIFALNGVPVSAPSSAKINCDTGSADALEEVGTAGSSGLNYDSTIDQYNYLWKSDKAWGGTCRLLTVELTDGTIHQAKFKFTK
jgi:hypothetical protein